MGVFHSFLHNSLSPFPKASLMAQMVNGLPAVQETQVPFLSQINPLEKETASHFSIPAWRIPWTEEPGRLQSMRSLRARYYWATNTSFSLKRVCKNEYKGFIFSTVKFSTLIIIKLGGDIFFKVSLFLSLHSQIYFLFGKISSIPLIKNDWFLQTHSKSQ